MEGSIEFLLDTMYNERERMRELDAEKSKHQAIYDDAEYSLTELMQAAGVRSAGTDLCTATLKQEKYPQIVDMAGFVQWCAENDHAEMIQKRVSKKPFDEFFEQTGEYPDGIDTYDKLTVGIRKR